MSFFLPVIQLTGFLEILFSGNLENQHYSVCPYHYWLVIVTVVYLTLTGS